ncbi:hypothetical protein [Streptomyces sp. NPDC017991]|uniref:hypothetical protein n=1 Tax=Streptomyces sp. NPDC017991 TaxID=3365026 RepID=UPI0037B89D2E
MWFGRNLDAWSDTIDTRGISDTIDDHSVLTVHVDLAGLFTGEHPDGRVLADLFDGEQNRLVIHAT